MHQQLRGIIARAAQCVKGHDFDGAQSALVEAELELGAIEQAQADAAALLAEGDPAGEPGEPLPDISPVEPGAEVEDGGGIHPTAEPGTEEQADGASEPPPAQVFQ
jgi:hypothetical protein